MTEPPVQFVVREWGKRAQALLQKGNYQGGGDFYRGKRKIQSHRKTETGETRKKIDIDLGGGILGRRKKLRYSLKRRGGKAFAFVRAQQECGVDLQEK